MVAKREAPLIVAHADGVGYCASDVAALIAHTRDVAALLDDQLARITPDGIEVVDAEGESVEPHAYKRRLGSRRRREAGLRALHAQGDPRAARRRSARPCATG